MKNEVKSDLWIYVLLQSALLIFIESLKTYHFTLYGNLISLSIPLIPFLFLITNIITKKFGYKKGLLSIIVSSISVTLFIILMSFSLNKVFDFSIYKGELLSYIISQLLNLIIYRYIQHNTKASYPIVFLTYVFSLIIFHMVYTLSYLDTTILDGYWIRYLLNISIEIIVCIFITILDKKVLK